LRRSMTVLFALLLTGCTTGENPTTTVTAAPIGYTIRAAVENPWLDDYASSSVDLVIDEFTCDEIERNLSSSVGCGIGRTRERPFAVVLRSMGTFEDEGIPMITLAVYVYELESGPTGEELRAVTVAAGRTETFLTSWVDNGSSYTILKAPTSVGAAILIHYQRIGGPRAWNVVQVVGANEFGSPQIVTTFQGEGMELLSEDGSILYTGYHYLANEGGCCMSYKRVTTISPDPSGWIHSSRTYSVNDRSWRTGTTPLRELDSFLIPMSETAEE